MNLRPSNRQAAVIEAYNKTTDNIVVRAVAGAGKTTLLKMIFPLVRGKGMYLAFNNSVVEELSGKISQPNIEISTIHSVGCKSIFRRFGKVKINKSKTYKFMKKESKKWELPKKLEEQYLFIIDRLVGLYRSTMCTDSDDLKVSADRLAIEYTDKHIEYSMHMIEVLKKYNRSPKEIDFIDMVYLPATDDSIQLSKPNTLFVDECQDLNAAQHALIDKLRSNGRFIAVGDPHQSIYGFTGAHSRSFELFVEKPKTVELPLSVTYRCPSRVVDHANGVYNVLECADNCIAGEVKYGSILDAKDGDMIICRNLSPLMSAFLHLIAADRKCYIKGKDMGESLIRLIKPFKGMPIIDMINELYSSLHEHSNNLIERGYTKPVNHPSYRSLFEKVIAIEVISQVCDDTNHLISKLHTIFSDEGKSGIVLSSMHKAKGLEADGVFILDRHLIPSKYAVTSDQKIQEKNLLYVAITRSKESLIYCRTNNL
jgi:superfamily I DNA/RNA helicase